MAVGMATNIPPHNLTEMLDAAMLLIRKPDATFKEVTAIVSVRTSRLAASSAASRR
ncbi:MAG: hypothetical protein R2724_15745 [Bryobacterales bacterium]